MKARISDSARLGIVSGAVLAGVSKSSASSGHLPVTTSAGMLPSMATKLVPQSAPRAIYILLLSGS